LTIHIQLLHESKQKAQSTIPKQHTLKGKQHSIVHNPDAK